MKKTLRSRACCQKMVITTPYMEVHKSDAQHCFSAESGATGILVQQNSTDKKQEYSVPAKLSILSKENM